MVRDDELDIARTRVLELFQRQGRDLTPREVIAMLSSSSLPESIVRSANISLVASGDLEITHDFKLHLVRELASAR
jgi:hypothetical protein